MIVELCYLFYQVAVTLGKGHEKKVKKIILPKPKAAPGSSESSSESSSDGIKMKVACDDGITLKVMVGDITKMPVDAIVNAANDRLKHTGGVALAISKAGMYSTCRTIECIEWNV